MLDFSGKMRQSLRFLLFIIYAPAKMTGKVTKLKVSLFV